MPAASFDPYARPTTWRARRLMPHALGIIQRKAVREGRLKSPVEMRREGWAWRLCGEGEIADRFFEATG